MNELQYEHREKMRSELAARQYLSKALIGEDEQIVLFKAAEVLDEAYPGIAPDRKGLERFSLLIMSEAQMNKFVKKVHHRVLEFEDVIFERDQAVDRIAL